MVNETNVARPASGINLGSYGGDTSYYSFLEGYQPYITKRAPTEEEAYYLLRGDDAPNYNDSIFAPDRHLSKAEYENFVNNWNAQESNNFNAYDKAYDLYYNSTANQTQLNTLAGYNPYYQGSFQTASQGAGAVAPKPASESMGYEKEFGLNFGKSIFDQVLSGVQSIYGALDTEANLKMKDAQIAKVNAETKFIKDSSPYRLNNLGESYFGKHLQNTQLAHWLFSNSDDDPGVLGIATRRPGTYGKITGSYYDTYLHNQSKSFENNIYRQNFVNNQLLPEYLKFQQLNNKLVGINADNAVDYQKVFKNHVIPAVINHQDYLKAFYENLTPHIKSDYTRGVVSDWVKVGAQVVGSVTDVFGASNFGKLSGSTTSYLDPSTGEVLWDKYTGYNYKGFK